MTNSSSKSKTGHRTAVRHRRRGCVCCAAPSDRTGPTCSIHSLLFDHFAFNDPLEGPIRGFPTHPHRGIETVTYMLDGNVRHRDSLGNAGVIGPGDVQWMTSGRGILHEEMPRRGRDGLIIGFQLWVNLPAAQKMSQPRYQEVSAASIPVAEQGRRAHPRGGG